MLGFEARLLLGELAPEVAGLLLELREEERVVALADLGVVLHLGKVVEDWEGQSRGKKKASYVEKIGPEQRSREEGRMGERDSIREKEEDVKGVHLGGRKEGKRSEN